VLGRPAFYLLALGRMASIGAVGGTMQNLKLYLSIDRGLGHVEAGDIGSIILIGSLMGRPLMGWLADRWPKKRVVVLIYVIVAGRVGPLRPGIPPDLRSRPPPLFAQDPERRRFARRSCRHAACT
jgi:MFS family permease